MDGDLIIAGGGIGGLAAALALQRAGRKTLVVERAPAFAEVGAGISLWPNATRILHALGVLEPLLAQGEPVTHFDLLRPDGSPISTVPMGGFATPALCLHRARLHATLLGALAPASLRPGRRLVSFTEDGEGVTLQCDSGDPLTAAGLIGADGIHSVVRAQLHGGSEPTYHGYTIWRGIAPDCGGIARGHISETWGAGRRFGIMPIGQGRVCWYATRNGPAGQPDAAAGRRAEIQELFRGWHEPVGRLLEATNPADILKNDARDRPALRRWGRGRVTLLGDAAHPITPNVGQGACMAIEDAACLAKLLGSRTDVAEVFQRYEELRRSRTTYVARQARRIGMVGQWELPWLVGARNVVTRLVLARATSMQLNTVYGYEV
jgi:2-polyprenyl-6-methoxyphenol hydroxylase-like FAD-dependent oxidoreductase